MDDYFITGFLKTAKSKLHKLWPALSGKAKQAISMSAGGAKTPVGIRRNLFLPQSSNRRTDLINQKVYNNFRNTQKNVIKQRSNTTPYAFAESSTKGKISLPKDPSAGKMTRATSRPDLAGAKGTHNRAMLEHEKAELKMELAKRKKSPIGKWARGQKAIYEGPQTVHSSIYPLVAEANIAGRNKKSLKDMMAAWKETPAQSKMFKKLKEHGWTPGAGLPIYGKASKKLQRVAEKEYGTQLGNKLKLIEDRIRKRFKGSSKEKALKDLKETFREFAK